MKKRILQFCSWILCAVMLVNMLPMGVFAEKFQQSITAGTQTTEQTADVQDAYVVEELPQGRTAYSKEYLLSNGVHMAAVYAEPVHYATGDGWEEIDNTLTARADGTIANTAGVWDVRFPQQLTRDAAITVEKDGHILLTEKGRAVAEKILSRHTILTEMLIRLGVSSETASNDACRIEHVVSDETFDAIKNHLQKYQ